MGQREQAILSALKTQKLPRRLGQVDQLLRSCPSCFSILLITGHLEPALLQRAMNAGAYDFLQKPIDRLLLVGALQRAIQMHQLQQQVQHQQRLLKDYGRIVGPLAERNIPAGRSVQPIQRSATPFQPPSWLL